MEDETSQSKGNYAIGIKGMGRKAYICISGVGMMAATQAVPHVSYAIGIVTLIGMGLQFILDLRNQDEEK